MKFLAPIAEAVFLVVAGAILGVFLGMSFIAIGNMVAQ